MTDVRSTLTELLDVEARLAALQEHRATLRGRLEADAHRLKRETGTAPTLRAKGLGSVTLTDPTPKAVVTDQPALAEWLLGQRPDDVEVALAVEGGVGIVNAVAEAIERVVNDRPTEAVRITRAYTVPTGLVDSIVEAGACPGSDQADEDGEPIPGTGTVLTAEGELVPGIVMRRVSEPTLQVRLEAEAKARQRAELAYGDEVRSGRLRPCPDCDAIGVAVGVTCATCDGAGVITPEGVPG